MRDPTSMAPDRPWTGLSSWLVSVILHAALVLVVGFTLRAQAPRGASDEEVRTTGIVLKRHSPEGELYEGEEESAAETKWASTKQEVDPLGALPEPGSIASPTDVLPALTAPLHSSSLLPSGVGRAATAGGGGGGGRGAIGGGEAQVKVFGLVGEGRKFVYVFDRTTSMEGGRLNAAKAELIRSLDALESVHQFQIVFFNHRPHLFDSQRIPFATERTKKLAANFVGGITAFGNTDREAALYSAIGMRPDVIFFLTDDDAPMSSGELDQVRLRNRGSASINTIEFGFGHPTGQTNFLVRLARENGGKYVYIDTSRL